MGFCRKCLVSIPLRKFLRGSSSRSARRLRLVSIPLRKFLRLVSLSRTVLRRGVSIPLRKFLRDGTEEGVPEEDAVSIPLRKFLRDRSGTARIEVEWSFHPFKEVFEVTGALRDVTKDFKFPSL